MRNTTLTILMAVGASLCCTGPILFASLGATSLSGFTLLEPIRPYMSITALGLLGFAFWRSYRPGSNEACCTVDERAQLRYQRRTLWTVSVVVAAFLALPYINVDGLYANDKNDVDNEISSNAQSTWIVEGMTCSGCALGLEASLAHEPGMEYCEVRYEEGRMDCRVDGSKLIETGIPDLVASYGYSAKRLGSTTAPTL